MYLDKAGSLLRILLLFSQGMNVPEIALDQFLIKPCVHLLLAMICSRSLPFIYAVKTVGSNFFQDLMIIREEKQHKHKLFGPDFPRTFLTLTPGYPGFKKFLTTTGAVGKRTFWCGCPRFSARTSMTRRVAEKLCTKKVCIEFWAPR